MRLATPFLLVAACNGGADPDYVSTTGPEHCGSITEDEVWAADLNPHRITCHVDIDGGTVTLAPGVEVRVGAIKHLSVNGASAGLLALGTAEDPVRLLAEDETLSWVGLAFWDGALGDLSFLELQHGGYIGYGSTPKVSLRVSGTEIRVEDVTISAGVDYGFALIDGGTFSSDSAGLVATGNVRPGYGLADVVGTVVMPGLDLTGNTEDTLVIEGNTITGHATWDDPGVPYVVGHGHTADVSGEEGAPASLTIGPGVELHFEAGANVGVGSYGPASLVVEGTVDQPVRFTSLTDDATSHWEGLRFSDATEDATTRLTNVELAHGGNGYYNYGNIHLENASPTIAGAWIHDSAAYGIYCEGTCAPTLSDVTYANNPDGDTNW